MGVVGEGDGAVEQLLILATEQEACLPRDGTARHRAQQMPDQRAADARVEDDWGRSAFDARGIHAGDGALCGERTDAFGRSQVFAVARRAPCIIALHRGAFTGDYADAEAAAG